MILEKIRQTYRSAEISTKITVTYAACFIFLLVIINTVMYFGTLRALYLPAARSINCSMQSVSELLEKLEQNADAVNPNTIREPLEAGVVLRAVDDAGNVFVNTDEHYPSVEEVASGILSDPPIFASDDMDVAAVDGALIYRAEMAYTYLGERVTIYFYRTIISEKFLLDDLENLLLILDAAGIVLAAGAGYIASRKVLKPIKTMTNHAQNIAFGKMGGRIEIPPSNDELAELAKTFNEMLDRIQGGIDHQQKFMLNASHELLNPVTAIYGCADLLKNYGADDREFFSENIESIFAEVHNVENILRNLLLLAQIDQNSQQLSKENLELSNIVEYAVDTTRAISPRHRIELACNDEATIFGDYVMIRQLIRIFLDSAVRNSPAGGEIMVSSVNGGGKVQLSISDTGDGFSQDELDKLFDRECKVSGGLGFAVAKWIASAHDIKISVASKIGAGTTFALEFPTD